MRESVWARYGPQQRLGVGMDRMCVDGGHGSSLHDAAGVHHLHAIAKIRHDPEVVRDEDHGAAVVCDQLVEKIETCACVVTSSAVVGSSQTMTEGSFASAIARSTRCLIPPEYWWG